MANNSNVDLLIIGAGPAGLMTACWAAQFNITTRIIDQKEGRTQTGRADGFQSRTLEILDSFGLAERIQKESVADLEACYWVSATSPSNFINLSITCYLHDPDIDTGYGGGRHHARWQRKI